MDIKLIERVQDLPLELFNQIKSEVLRHQLPEKGLLGFHWEKITATYKYPLQLHLNRASRQEFAQAYYGNTFLDFSSEELFRSFVLAMDSKHLLQLQGIRVSLSPELEVQSSSYSTTIYRGLRPNLKELMANPDSFARMGQEWSRLGVKCGGLVLLGEIRASLGQWWMSQGFMIEAARND